MAYFIALFAVALAAFYGVREDASSRAPELTPETAALEAQHFNLYRGWVQLHDQRTPDLAPGAIDDGSLYVPAGLTLPAFDHHAQLDTNGNVYVWTGLEGAFYAAVDAETGGATLCHVVASRQCVSARDTMAILPASLTPSYIPTGSTVYVWQR